MIWRRIVWSTVSKAANRSKGLGGTIFLHHNCLDPMCNFDNSRPITVEGAGPWLEGFKHDILGKMGMNLGGDMFKILPLQRVVGDGTVVCKDRGVKNWFIEMNDDGMSEAEGGRSEETELVITSANMRAGKRIWVLCWEQSQGSRMGISWTRKGMRDRTETKNEQ